MESSIYEKLGSRLTRYVKGGFGPESSKKAAADFVQLYERLPLFLVGLSENDLSGKTIRESVTSEFHLPFPFLLLEFPKFDRETYSHLESIQYSQTYHPVVFVAQISSHQFAFEVIVLSEESLNSFLYYADETKHLPKSYIDRYLSDIAFHVDYSGIVRIADDGTHYEVIPNLQGKSGTWITEFPDQAPVNLKNRKVKEFPVSFPTLTGYYVTDRESVDESEIAPIEYWAAIIVLSIYYINSPVTYIVRETEDLTPREQRLKQKAVKPFFAKHPRHIVLKYEQVKEIVARDGEKEKADRSKRSPLPHERRGHWRMLSADRFKEKRSVWVRPADVGKGMKVRIGHRTYEVIR